MGLKSWKLREKVCSGVESLGVEIDRELNMQASADKATLVSSQTSRTQVWVVPTDEEFVLLQEILAHI